MPTAWLALLFLPCTLIRVLPPSIVINAQRKKKESYLQSQVTLLFFLGIAKIVLFQSLAVRPLNVLDCQHRPVVLILRVLSTVTLIEVNL